MRLGKLFGWFSRGKAEDAFVDEPADKGQKDSKGSEARDEFYEMLMAQRQDASDLVLGDDAMAQEERMAAVQKIMPHTMREMVVANDEQVKESQDTSGEGDVTLVDAQDDSPEMDRIRNFDVYQVYARINPRILRHFVSRAFIGYPACTILGQHEVIGLCCSMPAEDAVASGFDLQCAATEHEKNDDHIQQESKWLEGFHRSLMDDDNILDLCVKYGTNKRLYGIGIAVPIVQLKDGHTLEEEYDPSFIVPHSFKGFNIIDPQYVLWDMEAESLYNPLSEFYLKPEYLRLVNGSDIRIHRSWVLTSNFREVGTDLKPTYMWGGLPLSQLLYERVFCADKLANEVVALAMSKRTVIKDGNLKAMINNPKKADYFIKRWNGFRNNFSVSFKEPGEQIQQLETSLSDLQPLSAQQYQWVASWSGIPITKLCKNVPSGLQATGQYQIEDYEQTIKPIRQDAVAIINRFCEMKIASEYPNRTDLAVTAKFRDFVSPKETEVQDIASRKAQRVYQLYTSNMITLTEARALLKAGDTGAYNALADKTPELLLKIEEFKDPEKAQQMQMAAQGGGAGGMPGMGGQPGAPDGGQGGQGGEGQEQQKENPQFAAGKAAFSEALAKVLAKIKENRSGAKPEEASSPEGQGQKQDNAPEAPAPAAAEPPASPEQPAQAQTPAEQAAS